MRYGYFDDEAREYVITRPDTPLPWINYLGSEGFYGLISNTAGGYCFYQDARLRRLTRYRYNNVPTDTGGRYLYLRDNDSGGFWSPSWQPTLHEAQDYTCRHGLGYSIIGSTYSGIEAQTRYFVPPGDNLEIWQLVISNRREQPANLSLFSCIEFCLWDAQDDATNYQRNLNIGEVEVEQGVIYHKTEYRERRDHFAYFACSEPLAGFDTQREEFLGAYRGWESPAVVESGQSADSIAHGWSPIGSHHVQMTLEPGESRQIIFLLGYHENPVDQKWDTSDSQRVSKVSVRPVIDKYMNEANADAAFEALQQQWSELLGMFRVDTPDEHTNRLVNIWNPYQCIVTFNLSRSASYYESGIGRGVGFRDANQDLLGSMHMDWARAKQRLLDIAATQLQSGGAYHQYQPLTKRGNDAIGGGFNDDPLWLVLSVSAYIKETGDWSILDEPAQYENQPGSEQPLYNHLQRSLNYTRDRLGPHGLPLIGRADWNDCLNLNTFSAVSGESFQTAGTREGKVAESLFIAGMFVLATREMAALAQELGREKEAQECLSWSETMRTAIDDHGWDGKWFLRAYDAFGDKVGSSDNDEGQIYIEPQGFLPLAGIGLDDGRAEMALASVGEHLATDHGIVVHQPAYTRYHLHLGEISSYPPGYKENAGIFCHSNPWVMIAEAMVGHGDMAHEYYLRINPSARESISDLHRCEPYIYAQMIAGKDAPTHGEAKNSWLTGTAAWNYVAITQWILGIRPTLHGLHIEPVIPADWSGFQATRIYRGTTYKITVRRAGEGNQVSLLVDGKQIEGCTIPFPPAGQTEVEVEAILH